MNLFKLALTAAFALALSLPAFASSETMKKDDMMSMHNMMGKMHMRMAECMKGGKTMDDCDSMMMKNCRMGEEKCKKMMTMMHDHMNMMMNEGMMASGGMMMDDMGTEKTGAMGKKTNKKGS
jgi:hypothetical protein